MPSQLAAHTVRSPAWNRTKIVRVTTACSAVELQGNGGRACAGQDLNLHAPKGPGLQPGEPADCSTDAECRQCRESNPEPRRLRRSFSSPDPCLVRRILTGLDQPASDAVAGDVPTTCGRLPRGFHRRVGVTGFEPATFRPQTGCATKLRHTPMLPSHVLASARPGFARRPIGSRRRLPGFACQCAAGSLLAQAQY